MSSASETRNFLLRRLYDLALGDSKTTQVPKAMLADEISGTSSDLFELILVDLEKSGLIEKIGSDHRAPEYIALTASGYYEAERLGGSFKAPASIKILKIVKDHQIIATVLAMLGLLVTAYPIYSDWQSRQAARAHFEEMSPLLENNIRARATLDRHIAQKAHCDALEATGSLRRGDGCKPDAWYDEQDGEQRGPHYVEDY